MKSDIAKTALLAVAILISQSSAGSTGYSIRDTDAIAVVNGVPLTFGELRKRADLTVKMAQPAKPGEFCPPVTQVRYGVMRKYFPELVNGKLLSALADKEGIEADPGRTKAAEGEFLRAVDIRHIDLSGEELQFAKETIKEDTRRRQLLENLYPDIMDFPESDIVAVSNRLQGFAAEAVASNKVQLALCEEIKRRIAGGMAFADAAELYSESDSDEGRFWARKAPEALENDRIAEWVATARSGTVGGPFVTGEGYSIIKLLEKSDMDGTVLLARITVARFASPPIPPRKELVRQMQEDRAAESMRDLLEKEHAKMVVEYPMGDDFWKILKKDLTDGNGDWKQGGLK